MSSISIHGARVGDRAVGEPQTGRMQPTDEQVGRQVRHAVQQLTGRSRLTGDALDKQALALVKTQHRGAVDLLGEEAIVALTRRLDPGGCNWCAVRESCKAKSKPLPRPASALRAALGSQCSRCKVAWNAAAVAEREDAYVAGLVAAGYSAEDAAYQRPGGPRATGVIWPAGREPAGVVASARQAARTPLPSYYQPRRPQ
jgi:hypothetical protein